MNNHALEVFGFVCLLLLGVGLAMFLSYVVAIIFEIRDEVYNIKHKLKKKRRQTDE